MACPLDDHPQRTFVFIHGFGGQAEQWQYQLQKFSMENRAIAIVCLGNTSSYCRLFHKSTYDGYILLADGSRAFPK